MLDTDLYWLAGFLEGDGTFAHRRVHGRWFQIQVTATNADRDVIVRCAQIAGGRVIGPYSKGDGKHGPNKVQWTWHLSTMKEAAELMRLLRPIMSERRRVAIDTALAAYEAKSEIPMGERTHCPQGHRYDEANTVLYRDRRGILSRRCKACRREQVRRWREKQRAAQGEG